MYIQIIGKYSHSPILQFRSQMSKDIIGLKPSDAVVVLAQLCEQNHEQL